MNPFDIGPIEAGLLTVWISCVVLACVYAVCEATVKVTGRICEAVDDMWTSIERIADNVDSKLKK